MTTGECRPSTLEGPYNAKPPPQFGEFQHEGINPRPNQEGPHVLVRNTFLDIDDRPPTPPALIRARTTPPGYPAAGGLVNLRKKDGGLREDGDEEDEEEDEDAEGTVPATPSSAAEPSVRHACYDVLEPGEGWNWANQVMTPAAAAVPSQLASPTGRAAPPPLGGAVGPATVPGPAAGTQLAPGQTIMYNGQPMQMVMMPVDFASGMPVLVGAEGGGPAAMGLQQPSRGGARWSAPPQQQDYLAQQQPLLPQQPQPALQQQVQQPQQQQPQQQQPQQQAPQQQQQQQQQPQQQTQQLQQLQHQQHQLPFPARPRQADSIHVESPTDPSTSLGPDGPYAQAGQLDDAGGASPVPPQPQTLTRAWSVNSGYFRVHWTVDARKLRGNDKQAVSPPFELNFGEQFPKVTFKMMIYPKVVNESKGGASFKKARGRGYVQLKCEAELQESIANVSFRISIGSGDNVQAPRGPVSHNFSSSAVCGLPKEEEEWDFSNVVDQESMTFVVCLEIVPTQPRR